MNRSRLMNVFFVLSCTILVLSFVGVYMFNMVKGGIGTFLMYFTVQTNILVVSYFAFYRTKFMQTFKTTITVLISITCIIYYAFIFKYANYINQMHFILDGGLHFVNPVLMITSNYLQKNRASYFTNLYVTLFCFAYLLFAFTIGQVLYSFLDIKKIGLYYVIGFVLTAGLIVNIYSTLIVKTSNYSYFKFKRRQQKNHKDYKETIKAVRNMDATVLQLKGTESKIPLSVDATTANE